MKRSGDVASGPSPAPEGGASEPRPKASHVGAPAIFALEQACQDLDRAFPEAYGCYLVGSALVRPDWRDVDVRMIFPDEAFDRLFPAAKSDSGCRWEFDPRWITLTVALSQRLALVTGLPIDFQFQPQSHANKNHKGRRSALGMYVAPEPEVAA